MKKHSGMRPHDIVVLIKIVAKGDNQWMMKDLSNELGISSSEVSESLNRSVIARLITPDKKRLMKLALLDFLEHGLCYVYPQSPGGRQTVTGLVVNEKVNVNRNYRKKVRAMVHDITTNGLSEATARHYHCSDIPEHEQHHFFNSVMGMKRWVKEIRGMKLG
jgi:hypothetical protein